METISSLLVTSVEFANFVLFSLEKHPEHSDEHSEPKGTHSDPTTSPYLHLPHHLTTACSLVK